jgi:ATP synthase protein I
VNKQLNKRGIIRLWLVQLGITIFLATLFFLVYSTNAAKSAVLGGLVCIIPNIYFALKVFQHEGARAAKQIVDGFYKGEAFKIIISIFLFTTVFVFFRITPSAFFVTYIMVLMSHWIAPWIIVNKQNRPESD